MSADPFQLPAWQSADGRHFYVFVYGTLRRGEINDIVLAAERHGIAAPTLIGTARVPGRLFDYGDWPGILPLEAATGLAQNLMQVDEQGKIDKTTDRLSDTAARGAMISTAAADRTDDAVSSTVSAMAGPHTNDWPMRSPTVLGDVFYASIALLAVLDDIEGIREHSRDAFYRAPCALRAASGKTLTCVYYPVDQASTVACPVIEGGDWIAYRIARGR